MMARGGARNRSGPPADPKSLKSAKTRAFTALPAEGYGGDVPDFPLPDPTGRELEVWAEAWRSPQAVKWAVEPWRHRTVAMWVRVSVACEDREVSASLLGQVHRFADQIGMTPAGLVENGWTITATVEAAAESDDEKDDDSNVVDMFRAIGGSA